MAGIFSQFDAQDLNRLAAKGIFDKLRTIRQGINAEFTARRLIWELIQNAKDNAALCLINGTPDVDIEIDLQKDHLIFRHNKGFFKNENIRGLIRRYSSSDKDRELDGREPSTTGRFGTGFMTTHMISEKVNVKGVFQIEENKFTFFELPLDRTGKIEKDIITGIEKSFREVEASIENAEAFDGGRSADFYTEFHYPLSHVSYEFVSLSLEELNHSVAYALVNLPQIKSIRVKHLEEEYYYGIKLLQKIEMGERPLEIYEICTNNQHKTSKQFASIREGSTSIIVPIFITGGRYCVKKPEKNTPRLFLDFPLIGTEELNLPFIINDPLFEPTESRNGVSLSGGDDDDTLTNNEILQKGFELFSEFVNYVSELGYWHDLFNLANIKKPSEREWIDIDWYKEEILKPFQKKLLRTLLVDTTDGNRISMQDHENKNQVYFPFAKKPEVREKIWKLSKDIYPGRLPKKEHIHEWQSVIWKDCYRQGIKELTEDIERIENLENLQTKIGKNEEETIQWLNDYFDLLNFEEEFISEIVNDGYSVIPNQKGKFATRSDLWIDKDIQEELKNVLEALDVDIRSKLRLKGVITKNAYTEEPKIRIAHSPHTQDQVIETINKKLPEQVNSAAINLLISLFPDTDEVPDHRQRIYEISIMFNSNPENFPKIKRITNWSDDLWLVADFIRVRSILKKVAQFKTIDGTVAGIDQLNEENIKPWLIGIVDMLPVVNLSDKLNETEYGILPNQNGAFTVKDNLFLDDGEIDEQLKDIARDLGYDIRSELLDKSFFLELPDYRVRTERHLAGEITKLIQPILRDLTEREENKKVIRELYVWMSRDKEKAQDIFESIYEKRFLLISDEEITDNIEKAEILDEIIEETGIGKDQLKQKIKDLIATGGGALRPMLPATFSPDYYPEGTEEDIAISPDLLDFSSERSRISASEEAKKIIFDELRFMGFIVPEDLSINYTIVTGIKKPDGKPVKVVVKSGRAGYIYFNPNEWIALSEPDSQLFVLTAGNKVRNVTLSDLEKENDIFHMRFNTRAFAIHSNLKSFADFFRYLPYTHFIFYTPESVSNFLSEFGLNKRNPSSAMLTADDKNILT